MNSISTGLSFLIYYIVREVLDRCHLARETAVNFLHLHSAVQDWGCVPQRLVLQAGTGQDLKLTPFLCQG